MNKKIVILIIVILLSFCFLGIVVADNVAHDDNHTTDHGKTIDKDKKADKNKTDDKNKTSDKNKTDNKTKKNYILAKGSGDDIKFSDGFRGFRLDYSKSPASWGDEFKRVSTSKASDSNTLKLAIIKCYELDSTDEIGDIMADFIITGYSDTEVGEAVEESYEMVSDHEVIEIDDDTVAVFDFEVLESVSGNESDYFAYKVSFRSIYDEDVLNLTNNLTNVTNMTNITGLTNITNMTLDNETNATFLKELYDFLLFLADMLYEAWKPIIDTIIGYFMMFIQAMEELVKMYEQLMAEIQSLMDALEKLLNMLESIWKEIDGLLKLIGILLTALQQLLNFIESLLNFILSLISQLIALLQQLLALLYSLINFLLDLLNQIASLLQAIFDFLKSVGSFLINVIENAAIIIIAFVIITIGAFVYNRIR